MLTGSASKGRHGGRYYYYHCSGTDCKIRFKAQEVNSYFEKEEQEAMLSNARKRLVKDEIDSDDFAEIKKGCNQELRRLEEKLSELPAAKKTQKTLESLLNVVVERFSNIDKIYRNADIEGQRQIIGSMFPENVCFDGTGHRTPRVSEPLALILLINNKLGAIKKGKDSCFLNLSPKGSPQGRFFEHLSDFLHTINNISQSSIHD